MKKIILSFLPLLLLAGTSCQETVDFEKEKEAIKAVIENETKYHFERNWKEQSKSFLQDESLIVLMSGKNYWNFGVGWEDISKVYKEIHERNPDPTNVKFQFSNFKIKVYEGTAWAVSDEVVHYDEDGPPTKYISVGFLEKVDGEWKLAYLSHVNTSSYEEEEVEEEEPVAEE